jgi:hypothetical protein
MFTAATRQVQMKNVYTDVISIRSWVMQFKSDDVEWQDELHWRRQVNGILGTAFPNMITFQPGSSWANVPVEVFTFENEPAIDPNWHEAVEASWEVTNDSEMHFCDFDGDYCGAAVNLSGGIYRVRFYANNYSRHQDIFEEWKNLAPEDQERYRLELWPAPWSSDRIIKATHGSATYWHAEQAKRLGRNGI